MIASDFRKINFTKCGQVYHNLNIFEKYTRLRNLFLNLLEFTKNVRRAV